ncbi:DUF2254 domain-containing protein [Erwinia sp. P7711]|uniref:DUF2254 domain-containing protein n=1 Tax=Erwinia sp. P7711 TaxID=3141451 RepID=UPI00318A0DC8
MTSKWHWLLSQMTRKLWFRTSLFAILAVITALISIVFKSFMPPALSGLVGTDAVDKILGILASSMLAVTTFSLNIMVSAYNAASSSVTPRATRLLVEDPTTQNVLATFIGSFLYSLVGIIALSMGAYGKEGRVVLFFVTLVVIILIIITLLRWIQHLAQFGQLGETTQRVEDATRRTFLDRLHNPLSGASEWREQVLSAENATPFYLKDVGYIQHIDMQSLSDHANEKALLIFIARQPGEFIHPAEPLLWISPAQAKVDTELLISSFTVRPQRSFDQDPRFGFCVLSEIASRALSPAVNDPGTAIDVIGRGVRLLSHWPSVSERDSSVHYPHLYMRPLNPAELFDDLFTGIARDGAGMIEVQIALQKALKALAAINPSVFAVPAKEHRLQAMERAGHALQSDYDRRRLSQFQE